MTIDNGQLTIISYINNPSHFLASLVRVFHPKCFVGRSPDRREYIFSDVLSDLGSIGFNRLLDEILFGYSFKGILSELELIGFNGL